MNEEPDNKLSQEHIWLMNEYCVYIFTKNKCGESLPLYMAKDILVQI